MFNNNHKLSVSGTQSAMHSRQKATWNVDLATVTGDKENVFIDYKDRRLCQVSGAKFKTNRREEWVEAHKGFFQSYAVETSPDSKSRALFLRIRKKPGAKIRLSVKFYQDGVVTAQGDSVLTWAFLYVPQMRASLGNSPCAVPDERTGSEKDVLYFNGKDHVLSNLCHDPIIVNNTEYQSVENCYQAEKWHKSSTKCPRIE